MSDVCRQPDIAIMLSGAAVLIKCIFDINVLIETPGLRLEIVRFFDISSDMAGSIRVFLFGYFEAYFTDVVILDVNTL